MSRKKVRQVRLLVALAIGILLEPSLAFTHPDQAVGPKDQAELASFLDRFFAEQMRKLYVPGAVFVLVKDGETLFAKGYGYANLEKKTPVIPDKTVFRVASVSKLFTATAVMQLVERGKLNLSDDVDKYLRLFKLENNYPRPVTVANLLTQTGGFADERFIGAAARSESELKPLGEYLARTPRVELPPGQFYVYSNYGMSLAGYLIEVVSGVPYTRYIEENILKPLGMTRSSFVLPPNPVSDLAVGYTYQNGTYKPVPAFYSNLVPASGLNATAGDMARFIIAHLQDGRCGHARILDESTAQEMHRLHFSPHPRLWGTAYGFYGGSKNKRRVLQHAGDNPGYASLVFLLPDERLGFFVSYTNDDYRLREALVQQFLEHYYPAQKAAPPRPPAGFQSRAERFAGSYRSRRYARHTLEKLSTLFAQFHLTESKDGTLTVHYPAGLSQPSQWVEIEPLLFQRADDHDYMAFREDGHGRVTGLFMNSSGYEHDLERLPWYETAGFQLKLSGLLLFVFLSACVAWPLGFLIRRFRKQSSPATRSAQAARLLAGLISALNPVFLIGLVLAFTQLNQWDFLYGVPRAVTALLLIPLMTTAMTAGLPIFTVLAWKGKYWGLSGRLHYSLVTLAALAFIPFLLYWNLLGFRY